MGFGKISAKKIKSESRKCKLDPRYFIKKYVKIVHPLRGRIPFELYPFQEDLLEMYMGSQHLSILKARQLGISTLSAAYILWYMFFHEEKQVMVVAIKEKTAINVIKKVKKMYKSLPDWLKRLSQVGDKDNITEFELANGSRCFASTTNSSAGRSESLSLLVIDEAAFVPKLGELMKALGPTLSTGGRAIVLSTPNGAQGWFYKNHIAAQNGKNDYAHVELPWHLHPEHDQEWFEKQKRLLNNSEQAIAQEHLCSFTATGDTVIQPKRMTQIEEGDEDRNAEIAEPLYKTGPLTDHELGGSPRRDPGIWVWDDHSYMHEYIISADVARGDGNDYSAFHVIDITSGEQVAEAQLKVDYGTFAGILVEWGTKYGNCPVIIENNILGSAVCEEIIRTDYNNLYYTKRGKGTFHPRWEAEGRAGYVPGVYMSSAVRPLVIAKFSEYIHSAKIRVRSERLANEMRGFVWHNSKEQAAGDGNDDLIMSFALACYAHDVVYGSRELSMVDLDDDIAIKISRKNRVDSGMILGFNPKDMSVKLSSRPRHRGMGVQTAEMMSEYGWVLK